MIEYYIRATNVDPDEELIGRRGAACAGVGYANEPGQAPTSYANNSLQLFHQTVSEACHPRLTATPLSTVPPPTSHRNLSSPPHHYSYLCYTTSYHPQELFTPASSLILFSTLPSPTSHRNLSSSPHH